MLVTPGTMLVPPGVNNTNFQRFFLPATPPWSGISQPMRAPWSKRCWATLVFRRWLDSCLVLLRTWSKAELRCRPVRQRSLCRRSCCSWFCRLSSCRSHAYRPIGQRAFSWTLSRFWIRTNPFWERIRQRAKNYYSVSIALLICKVLAVATFFCDATTKHTRGNNKPHINVSARVLKLGGVKGS